MSEPIRGVELTDGELHTIDLWPAARIGDRVTINGHEYHRQPASPIPLESMIEEMGDIVSISRVAESLQEKAGGKWLAWINPGSLVRPFHKDALRGGGDTVEEAVESLHAAWRERE